MTYAHISHFGLEHELTTATSVCFSGSLADCTRMAAAHGLEIDRYEGRVISSDGRKALYESAGPDRFMRIYFRKGGMIHKLPDNIYWLSIPREVWDAEV